MKAILITILGILLGFDSCTEIRQEIIYYEEYKDDSLMEYSALAIYYWPDSSYSVYEYSHSNHGNVKVKKEWYNNLSYGRYKSINDTLFSIDRLREGSQFTNESSVQKEYFCGEKGKFYVIPYGIEEAEEESYHKKGIGFRFLGKQSIRVGRESYSYCSKFQTFCFHTCSDVYADSNFLESTYYFNDKFQMVLEDAISNSAKGNSIWPIWSKDSIPKITRYRKIRLNGKPKNLAPLSQEALNHHRPI